MSTLEDAARAAAELPEPVVRVLRFAGKTRREVTNPCLTARETIVLADWIAKMMQSAESAKAELSDERLDKIAVQAICRHGSEKTKDALLHDHGPYGITRCNHDTMKILHAVVREARSTLEEGR